MSELNITGEDLLAWNDVNARKWRDFVTLHPLLLTAPCDIREATSAGQLLQHIVAVELRYAQRLKDLPETHYADVPFRTGDEILDTHNHAMAIVRILLADPDYDWGKEIEFTTISAGKMKSTRKSIFIHLMMHGMRHYAQLATLARQNGFKPDWPMDYLYMEFIK
jgi:uncharacterized damage-inducible protein DinB